MAEVDIKFERENRQGTLAVGAYIIDAFKRLGIRLDEECDAANGHHVCSVTILSGVDLLSPRTTDEINRLGTGPRSRKRRFACHAKLDLPGEVVIMTSEKKRDTSEKVSDKSEDYRKDFAGLPLEKKIADLLQLEAITLGETFTFVLNSPLKVFEKAMDVMAEFGLKLEKEAKDAARPEEHKSKSAKAPPRSSSRSRTKKNTASEQKSADAK
ncbi:MAG: hypothetical protein WBD22_11840 [Pyrinomonadaceae bacterium]